MLKNRFEIIDGFRAIAIISVLLYHFTNPWVVKYPHQDFFLHIFKFGYLGVNFFFMISGFVICYTLERSPNLSSFYVKRFARLFPAMFLCSLLIFIVIHFLDTQKQFPDAHEPKNLLPGLTFISPQLWTLITGVNYRWINGSFWSIWVEIQFYIIASGLYFASRKKFHNNIFFAGIFIAIIKYIPNELLKSYPGSFSKATNHLLTVWRSDDEIFNITFWITWFLCGAALYYLHIGHKNSPRLLPSIYLIISLLNLINDTSNFYPETFKETIIASIIMVFLFLLMIYYERSLSFLKTPPILRVGLISYSIYLIHEQIGILLINKYEKHLGNWNRFTPFLVIALVIGFGELSYRFYESRVSKAIRNYLLA